jgi:hypothetical protein
MGPPPESIGPEAVLCIRSKGRLCAAPHRDKRNRPDPRPLVQVYLVLTSAAFRRRPDCAGISIRRHPDPVPLDSAKRHCGPLLAVGAFSSARVSSRDTPPPGPPRTSQLLARFPGSRARSTIPCKQRTAPGWSRGRFRSWGLVLDSQAAEAAGSGQGPLSARVDDQGPSGLFGQHLCCGLLDLGALLAGGTLYRDPHPLAPGRVARDRGRVDWVIVIPSSRVVVVVMFVSPWVAVRWVVGRTPGSGAHGNWSGSGVSLTMVRDPEFMDFEPLCSLFLGLVRCSSTGWGRPSVCQGPSLYHERLH